MDAHREKQSSHVMVNLLSLEPNQILGLEILHCSNVDCGLVYIGQFFYFIVAFLYEYLILLEMCIKKLIICKLMFILC